MTCQRIHRSGARARPAALPPAWLALAALLLAMPRTALAQGQDSVTAPMGPQTSAHPPPLLSQASVTAVPSGHAVTPPAMPVARPEPGNGLALPGMVRLAAPQRLACGEIQDGNARKRCEGLPRPPAPPRGGQP